MQHMLVKVAYLYTINFQKYNFATLKDIFNYAENKIHEMGLILHLNDELLFQRLITNMCINGLQFSSERAVVSKNKINQYNYIKKFDQLLDERIPQERARKKFLKKCSKEVSNGRITSTPNVINLQSKNNF